MQEALVRGDVSLDAGEFNFQIAPRTLAGVLTMQATRTMIIPQHFRKCAHCQGWFAVGRADQRYCMAKHRFAAQKERVKEP